MHHDLPINREISIEDNSKVFRPFFCRDGNKVIKEYEEDFVDQAGNCAIITYIDYIDKKGKVTERIVRYVKWLGYKVGT